MAVNRFFVFLALTALVLLAFVAAETKESEEKQTETVTTSVDAAGAEEGGAKEDVEIEPEVLEYHKGSLCGYCSYCQFCRLCDRDCPCEVGPGRPNCHLCKYCKFCYLCKMCDTFCQPGGIIDRVSSSIISSLPSYNREEIDKDIDGVQNWIERAKKDEL